MQTLTANIDLRKISNLARVAECAGFLLDRASMREFYSDMTALHSHVHDLVYDLNDCHGRLKTTRKEHEVKRGSGG